LVAAAVASMTIWVLGCVSQGTHKEVVAERDRLLNENVLMTEKAGHLEVSNASLEAERVRLYDELEDLRVETEALQATRATLEQDVMRLSESQDDLSSRLEAAESEAKKLKSTYQGLVADLESELQKGEIEIEQLRSGLRVAVSDEILFRSGSADLDNDGRAVLRKVAENISRLDYAVDVEGHTDDVPILGPLKKKYPTNWELAAARASSVVRLFAKSGIDGERLQAISRAEFSPVASNQSAEGRGLNRRIEIRLRPRDGSEVAPAPLDAAAASSEPPAES
jgi:chemotaxis protein MotB